jgi:hypothetical protein
MSSSASTIPKASPAISPKVDKSRKTAKDTKASPPPRPPLLQAIEEVPVKVTYFDIYERIYQIYANDHFYHKEWQTVKVPDSLLESLVKLVRHQEEVAQLKGLGLWLLQRLLQCPGTDRNVLFGILSKAECINDIIRMLAHQSNHGHAFSLLIAMIDTKMIKFKDFYSTGKSFKIVYIYLCLRLTLFHVFCLHFVYLI